MRRTLLTLVLTAGGLLAAGSSASAQIFQTGGYVNPFTPVPNYGATYYNPWNGGSAYRSNYFNPYTGTTGFRQSYSNPYTGRYGTYQSRYNPYTNQYQYRYYNGRRGW